MNNLIFILTAASLKPAFLPALIALSMAPGLAFALCTNSRLRSLQQEIAQWQDALENHKHEVQSALPTVVAKDVPSPAKANSRGQPALRLMPSLPSSAQTILLARAPSPRIVPKLYISKEGAVIGEVDLHSIKEMLKAGQLLPHDYYFDAENQKWERLSALNN